MSPRLSPASFPRPKILFNCLTYGVAAGISFFTVSAAHTIPPLARDVNELRAQLPSGKLALVPTMGALHEGHLSLVRRARAIAEAVAVSVYVNPLQFAPHEDFAEYPRDLEGDRKKLAGIADVVFAPPDGLMYPQKQTATIALPPLAGEMCGASRPGFFEGVVTVVCKLFNLVHPDVAVFGKKDWQQAHLVGLAARQLNFPVAMEVCNIAREPDGLALSSRNKYLTPAERNRAPLLHALLQTAAAEIQNGKPPEDIRDNAINQLREAGFAPDYWELRDAETLTPAPPPGVPAVLLAAATLGKTRLLDNAELRMPPQ